MQSRLREHCARHGDKSWIVGVGWDQSPWGRYPSRHDLDQVRPPSISFPFSFLKLWAYGSHDSRVAKKGRTVFRDRKHWMTSLSRQVESTRPMVLYRACWHIVVANSEALRRAGIPVEVRVGVLE